MNNNKVNVTQLALLLLLAITGDKFMSLPSVLARDVGHDSWLVLCINFFFDAICLCFVLWAIKLNKQQFSFDVILNKTVSKVVSKVILAIFFVIFMSKTIILVSSCYETFAVTFDVNTNWLLFILPIVATAGFAISRGFNSVARVGQLLFGLIFFAIVAILIYPTTKAEFSQLLPLGEAGFGKLMGTAFLRSFWFSDYIFIYFILEDIKPQKKLFLPMLTSFAVGIVLTILLNTVFVSLFGSYAPVNSLAMSKIGLFSVSESTDGRWDWLTLTIWLISVVLKIIIFIFCAYKCVEKILERNYNKVDFFVIMVVIAAILTVPMFLPVSKFLNTFVFWGLIPFAVVQYAVPLALPLLTKLANKNEEKKVENEQS